MSFPGGPTPHARLRKEAEEEVCVGAQAGCEPLSLAGQAGVALVEQLDYAADLCVASCDDAVSYDGPRNLPFTDFHRELHLGCGPYKL